MLRNYIKIALKVLARRKFFTFISLFGISFTLLVLIVAAALLDYIFAARGPEKDLDRMLSVYQVKMDLEGGFHRTSPAGWGFLERTLRDLPGAEEVTFYTMPSKAAGYRRGRKLSSFLKRTDAHYWRVFQFEFLEGRPYTTAEVDAASQVAVVNHSTAERYFGTDSAVGKTVEIDGQRFRIVGVVADVPFIRINPFSDVWVPVTTVKGGIDRRALQGNYTGTLLARRRGDLRQIRSEFAQRLEGIQRPAAMNVEGSAGLATARLDKNVTGIRSELQTFFEYISAGPTNRPHPVLLRTILISAALLFMVLPAMNLVSLNLSRVMERSSEIGVRKAFGAASSALVGQFIVENVILTLFGGLGALVLASLVLRFINSLGVIPYAQLSVDPSVFGWGLLLALVFGLVSGIYPAWRMSRLHPVQALHGGAQ